MNTEHVEFRAMGSPCRIVVGGPDAGKLAGAAQQMVIALERRWTRFDSESDISRLNASAGCVVLVSEETYALVEHAAVARRSTTGRFNPLMLAQLESHGYVNDWDQGTAIPTSGDVAPASLQVIELFPEIQAVCIPPGSKFDPGGIGKGLAADRVTEFLVSNGAPSSSVELGGDLRVAGTPWYGPEWRIAVAHPRDRSREIAAFTTAAGAVATSSRLRRRWSHDGQSFHHLLDPTTGRPAETDVVTSSCCAPTAWWAEVVAKVGLIAGTVEAIQLFDRLGVAGVIVDETGTVSASAGLVSSIDLDEQMSVAV